MDRNQALQAFQDYVSGYEPNNPRIALKIDHTLRVAELCERIANSLSLEQNDIDLAWLLGLLHDIGRFEQVRIYDSYRDSATVDHAALGAKILFKKDPEGSLIIRRFVDNGANDELIRLAVGMHSAYRLPESLGGRERMFCDILRDADKVDIVKVNCICPIEDIYGVSEQDLTDSELSPACIEGFYEHRCLPRDIRQTPADILLSHVCFAWEIVFPESLVCIREQGYLHQMLGRNWAVPATRDSFAAMAEHMERELGV